MRKLLTGWAYPCAAAFIAVSIGAGTLLAGPPTIDIPETDIRLGTLGWSHKQQIISAVDYWVSAIRDANDAGGVIKARTELLKLFNRYDFFDYQYFFADEAAKKLVALLLGPPLDTKYRQLKEVNAALALAGMPMKSVHDELAGVVRHPNAGVRYLAWLGYRRIRSYALSTGADRKEMFSLLERAAAQETSPPVVGMIFRMLQIRSEDTDMAVVSPEVLQASRLRAYKIVKGSWDKRMQQVIAGDSDMADACNKGVRTLLQLGMTMNPTAQTRREIMQMIVDAMYCGAQAYKSLWGTRSASIVPFAMLLRDSEIALNAMAGTQHKFIETPLRSKDITDRGKAVNFYYDRDTGEQYGVIKWIDTLKGQGIVKPPYKLPADETPPAPSG